MKVSAKAEYACIAMLELAVNYGEPQPVRLGSGTFFGELALLGNGVRNATVRATSPTTLLVLDLPDFRVFSASHRELSLAIEAEARRRADGSGNASVASDGRACASGI